MLRAWRKRLAESGFNDLENEYAHVHGDALLSNAGMAAQADAERPQVDAAQEVLRHHRFRSARDRRIWALHAEGKSVRAIVAATGWSIGTVQNTIDHVGEQVKTDQRPASLRRLIKQADLRTLFALGELIVRAHG